MLKKQGMILLIILFSLGFFGFTAEADEQVIELYYNNQQAEAVDYLVDMLENEERDLTRLEIYRNLAFLERERGRYEQAADYFRMAGELDDSLRNRLDYALTLYQNARYDQAEAVFAAILQALETGEKAFSSGEEKNHFYFYAGLNNLALEKEGEAISLWQQGLKHDKGYINYYLALGQLAEAQGDIIQAAINYEQAYNKDRSLTAIIPAMAEGLEKKGEYRQAFRYWQRAINVGVEEELARNRADILRDRYPELKPDPDRAPEPPSWLDPEAIEVRADVPLVDVGLATNINKIRFQVDSPFHITDSSGEVLVEGGSEYTEWSIEQQNNRISIKRQGYLVTEFTYDEQIKIEPLDEDGTILLYEVQYGSGYYWANQEDRQYRGTISVNPRGPDSFNVINQVNLEEYLISVVPAEMPAYWPEAALRAQALAARSYSMFHLDKKHAKDGYDLCATVHCAVYKGVNSEHPRTTAAVLATTGEVGTYQGEPIDAVFSSNSGGHTEASQYVWGGERAYLQGVSTQVGSGYEFPLMPAELYDWLRTRPESYSGVSPYSYRHAYRWIRELSLEVLADNYHLAEITDIQVTERTPSGYVKEVEVTGSGEKIKIRGDIIRNKLGGIRSNNFVLSKSYNPAGELIRVVLYGAGWGHGVGLDQTASAGMAEAGFDHRKIFTHFYEGVVIEELY
ncbi:MAG: SpoIID/LytB domain-containing protein [Bacillota bacterium]